MRVQGSKGRPVDGTTSVMSCRLQLSPLGGRDLIRGRCYFPGSIIVESMSNDKVRRLPTFDALLELPANTSGFTSS